tara:strand:- start:167 stop:298 length:132 start_codon:yes stop_codon:yes gene_type:complete
MFEITGGIDFGGSGLNRKDGQRNSDKSMMKLDDFVDLMNKMFN